MISQIHWWLEWNWMFRIMLANALILTDTEGEVNNLPSHTNLGLRPAATLSSMFPFPCAATLGLSIFSNKEQVSPCLYRKKGSPWEGRACIQFPEKKVPFERVLWKYFLSNTKISNKSVTESWCKCGLEWSRKRKTEPQPLGLLLHLLSPFPGLPQILKGSTAWSLKITSERELESTGPGFKILGNWPCLFSSVSASIKWTWSSEPSRTHKAFNELTVV